MKLCYRPSQFIPYWYIYPVKWREIIVGKAFFADTPDGIMNDIRRLWRR